MLSTFFFFINTFSFYKNYLLYAEKQIGNSPASRSSPIHWIGISASLQLIFPGFLPATILSYYIIGGYLHRVSIHALKYIHSMIEKAEEQSRNLQSHIGEANNNRKGILEIGSIYLYAFKFLFNKVKKFLNPIYNYKTIQNIFDNELHKYTTAFASLIILSDQLYTWFLIKDSLTLSLAFATLTPTMTISALVVSYILLTKQRVMGVKVLSPNIEKKISECIHFLDQLNLFNPNLSLLYYPFYIYNSVPVLIAFALNYEKTRTVLLNILLPSMVKLIKTVSLKIVIFLKNIPQLYSSVSSNTPHTIKAILRGLSNITSMIVPQKLKLFFNELKELASEFTITGFTYTEFLKIIENSIDYLATESKTIIRNTGNIYDDLQPPNQNDLESLTYDNLKEENFRLTLYYLIAYQSHLAEETKNKIDQSISTAQSAPKIENLLNDDDLKKQFLVKIKKSLKNDNFDPEVQVENEEMREIIRTLINSEDINRDFIQNQNNLDKIIEYLNQRLELLKTPENFKGFSLTHSDYDIIQLFPTLLKKLDDMSKSENHKEKKAAVNYLTQLIVKSHFCFKGLRGAVEEYWNILSTKSKPSIWPHYFNQLKIEKESLIQVILVKIEKIKQIVMASNDAESNLNAYNAVSQATDEIPYLKAKYAHFGFENSNEQLFTLKKNIASAYVRLHTNTSFNKKKLENLTLGYTKIFSKILQCNNERMTSLIYRCFDTYFTSLLSLDADMFHTSMLSDLYFEQNGSQSVQNLFTKFSISWEEFLKTGNDENRNIQARYTVLKPWVNFLNKDYGAQLYSFDSNKLLIKITDKEQDTTKSENKEFYTFKTDWENYLKNSLYQAIIGSEERKNHFEQSPPSHRDVGIKTYNDFMKKRTQYTNEVVEEVIKKLEQVEKLKPEFEDTRFTKHLISYIEDIFNDVINNVTKNSDENPSYFSESTIVHEDNLFDKMRWIHFLIDLDDPQTFELSGTNINPKFVLFSLAQNGHIKKVDDNNIELGSSVSEITRDPINRPEDFLNIENRESMFKLFQQFTSQSFYDSDPYDSDPAIRRR